MANNDVGNERITAAAGTSFTLRLTSRLGAVIATSYELAQVASPPPRIERRAWNDLDFQKDNPRIWDLPIGLAPGRYRCTVVSILQAPNTELEVALLRNGVVAFLRTAYADKPAWEGIVSFVLTLE